MESYRRPIGTLTLKGGSGTAPPGNSAPLLDDPNNMHCGASCHAWRNASGFHGGSTTTVSVSSCLIASNTTGCRGERYNITGRIWTLSMRTRAICMLLAEPNNNMTTHNNNAQEELASTTYSYDNHGIFLNAIVPHKQQVCRL